MEKPIENFWHVRMAQVKTALEANNFEAFLAENKEATDWADAHRISLDIKLSVITILLNH